MSVDSLAARARGTYASATAAPSARDAGADLELRRHLLWAAPAGAGFATLAAAAGGALGDRPTILGGLVLVAAVTMVPLLFRGLVSRIRLLLDGVVGEREALRAELAAAHWAQEELRNLAYHDELTGLPNRSLLYDRLGLAITHAHRQSTHVALLFLDLDDFKTVNDRFGHGFGDRLLVELATRVRGSVRAGDTVARFGGDEFVVLLDGVSGPANAAQVAGKVRDAVRAPFRLEGSEFTIGASVGVSVYPEDGTSSDELVRSADAAMYRDKQREMQLHERSGIR